MRPTQETTPGSTVSPPTPSNGVSSNAAATQGKRRGPGRPPVPFEDVIRDLKNQWDSVDKADIDTRYEFAADIHRILKIRAYGKGLVARIAAGVDREKSTVYNYKKVAEAWPKKQELNRLRDDAPNVLSWTRLIDLASDKNGRDERIKEILRTKKWVERAKKPSAPRSATTGAPPNIDTATLITGLAALSTASLSPSELTALIGGNASAFAITLNLAEKAIQELRRLTTAPPSTAAGVSAAPPTAPSPADEEIVAVEPEDLVP